MDRTNGSATGFDAALLAMLDGEGEGDVGTDDELGAGFEPLGPQHVWIR